MVFGNHSAESSVFFISRGFIDLRIGSKLELKCLYMFKEERKPLDYIYEIRQKNKASYLFFVFYSHPQTVLSTIR